MVSRHTRPSPYWEPTAREELEHQLAGIAEQAAGCWSFAVAEEGPVAGFQQDLVQPAASTIKVPLLLVALTEIARGNRDPGETVTVPAERTGGSGVLNGLSSVTALRLDETLELMVTISDNTATNMVIDLLGCTTIENHMRDMGLTDTSLRRHMLDEQARQAGNENLASAAELTALLDRLCTTALLPEPLRDTALGILGRQQINDRIPAYLPDDVQCMHKTGELPGVRHDIGILRFDGRTIAFAGMSCDLPAAMGTGAGLAAEVIGTAARAVVDLADGSA